MSDPRPNNWRARIAAAMIAGGIAIGAYLATTSPDKTKPAIDTTVTSIDPTIIPDIDRIAVDVDPLVVPDIGIQIESGVIVIAPDVDDRQTPGGSVAVPNVRAAITDDVAVSVPKIKQQSWRGRASVARLMIEADDMDAADAVIADRMLTGPRVVRSMPWLVGCSTYEATLARPTDLERQLQMKVDGTARVVRFGEGGDDEAAAEMVAASDRPVFVVVMFDYLPDTLIDVASLDQVAGIIIGHASHADESTADFHRVAASLDRNRVILQKVTTAPVLLAISIVNAHDANPARVGDGAGRFVVAFGDAITDWDGYAIYNLNRFAALETIDPATLRDRLGLTVKPIVLFELIGTNHDTPRARDIWRRKAVSMPRRLVRHGWASLILYSRFDVEAKAYAVAQLVNNAP